MKRLPVTFSHTALAGACLVIAAAPALGAGFALQENSASGLGNAYAGGAAVADDATTLWSNAAGMARLGTGQVAGVLNLIWPSIEFRNAGSVAALQQPLGGEGGNAGGLNVVPNLYLSWPIDRQWSVGLGVNAPFGLKTEYDDGWVGRFQGLKSEIKTINVNPAVSWKPMDNLSFGLGANYQTIEATFTSNANYSAALLAAAGCGGPNANPQTCAAIAQATPGLQSNVDVTGSDSAWGWNLGVLVELTPDHRIGAQYRSALKYDIGGDVTFDNPSPASLPQSVQGLAAAVNDGLLYDSSVSSRIKLPEIVNVSYFGRLNERWDLMADLQYTGWSSIQALTFTRGNGDALQTTTENFRNAWRFALGTNYRYDAQWLLRGGLAYDQTPVQDGWRTVRLPDSDRTWLTLGARYTPDPKWWVDVGAAYIWVKSGSIDEIGSSNFGQPPSAASSARVVGSYDNNVIVLSAQVTVAF
jgi:long-chain fatty acid transport protein